MQRLFSLLPCWVPTEAALAIQALTKEGTCTHTHLASLHPIACQQRCATLLACAALLSSSTAKLTALRTTPNQPRTHQTQHADSAIALLVIWAVVALLSECGAAKMTRVAGTQQKSTAQCNRCFLQLAAPGSVQHAPSSPLAALC